MKVNVCSQEANTSNGRLNLVAIAFLSALLPMALKRVDTGGIVTNRRASKAWSVGADKAVLVFIQLLGGLNLSETTKPSHFCEGFVLYGAGTRSRTRDLLITSQLLYQLSYTGVWATIIAIGCVL